MDETRIPAELPLPEMNRILLVDDEVGTLALLERLVTPLGYQCTKAGSGEEAREILSRENYSIMLTDMIMPGMDGMELLRYARKKYPAMEVMILTGFSMVYSFTDVIREGAADFLEKPVNKEELKAKLHRISREQVLRHSLRQEIEERKKAEAQLKEHQLQLHELIAQRTKELKKSNEKLQLEIEERLGAEKEVRSYAEKIKLFAYYVSHDLKTPALAIGGLADRLLRKSPVSEDGKFAEICRQISGATQQLIKLADNLNVYIQSKESPLELEEVGVAEVLEKVRGEFAEILGARGVELAVASTLPQVKADSLALTRVFRNYIDNALKYGGERLARIEVSCLSQDGEQIFRIMNDGIAIKPEEAERIFGLFNRSNTLNDQKGAGLGLAIVREIAERHQGRAWVEFDTPGRTVFCISIGKDL